MGRLIRAEISFEGDSATKKKVESALAAAGVRKVAFRTGELRPLRQTRAVVRTPFPEPDTELRLHTLTIQSDQNLIETGRALLACGVKAWINVATPQGPQPMELAEYLRLRGLV